MTSNGSRINSEDEDLVTHESEETEICFSCFGPNEPGVHFCRHCQTPLTSYASTGPLERVYALGDFFRKAAVHPKPLIRWAVGLFAILLAVGLLFGMMLP